MRCRNGKDDVVGPGRRGPCSRRISCTVTTAPLPRWFVVLVTVYSSTVGPSEARLPPVVTKDRQDLYHWLGTRQWLRVYQPTPPDFRRSKNRCWDHDCLWVDPRTGTKVLKGFRKEFDGESGFWYRHWTVHSLERITRVEYLSVYTTPSPKEMVVFKGSKVRYPLLFGVPKSLPVLCVVPVSTSLVIERNEEKVRVNETKE